MNVAVLLSGGVDSAVVVHRLKEQGIDPTLFYIRIGMDNDEGDCSAEEDIEMCTYIARKYGLPFEVVSLHREYWDHVMEYALRTVKLGLTPNPDMMCNKMIKFGFFEERWGHAFDKTATGHYATTTERNGKIYLSTARDKKKDQTDFLAQIDSVQVSHLLFPIGDLLKQEVREMAVSAKLPNASRRETYNIRFGELASLEELASHIKSFNPDFVALQEIDCKTDRGERAPHQIGRDYISELAYFTKMFGVYGKTIDYKGGYYGIGILSRYPYIDTKKTFLPWPNKAHERRALLEGLFEIGEDTICFASTHLDYQLPKTREAQTAFITEHFNDYRYPVVLGGDFNTAPSSKEIKYNMLENWFLATDYDFTVPAWNPKRKIDYIFARPKQGWKIVRTQTVQSVLSDHLPIVTELEYVKY